MFQISQITLCEFFSTEIEKRFSRFVHDNDIITSVQGGVFGRLKLQDHDIDGLATLGMESCQVHPTMFVSMMHGR